MDAVATEIQRAVGGDPPHLPAARAERLAVYLAALLECAAELNLTGASGPQEALDVLVRPSLAVWRAWDRPAPPRVAVDVGSGNGFPGVAVAVLWPASTVFLVERRRKKARAIADCLDRAGLRNAQVLALDVREIPRERPVVQGQADLVTARAVGPLGFTTRVTASLLAPGGRIVHWKAADLDEAERQEGARVARARGLTCLPEMLRAGGRGRLVIYERPEPSP